METNGSTLGERLKQLREAFSFSQRDLAERAGVSPGAVVHLEHDARTPRPSTVRKLANALGVSPSYLTGHEVAAEAVAASPRARRRVGSLVGGAPLKTEEPVLGFMHAPESVPEDTPARERPKIEVKVTGVPDEAAAHRLEQIFERWMDEDEESGEPDGWPETARSLDEDRTSYRKFFE